MSTARSAVSCCVRRGWRKSVGDAPLRENLAACMLIAAGWTGDEPLLDPFCGAGTLPIEATLLASGVNPGAHRRYTCDQWPASDGKIHTPARKAISVPIIGSDRDPKVLEAAQQNAQRAKAKVLWTCVEVQHLETPNVPPGLIVTNPPYGKRLTNRSEDSVHDLYDQFAITLQERFKGWRVSFLAPHRSLAARLHPQVEQLTSFSNGGLRVGLWVIDHV